MGLQFSHDCFLGLVFGVASLDVVVLIVVVIGESSLLIKVVGRGTGMCEARSWWRTGRAMLDKMIIGFTNLAEKEFGLAWDVPMWFVIAGGRVMIGETANSTS
ncbi:hypothetical protein O9G_005911 [Rozella allomycis CSF55]|uniref:Uncharacterized protein n=1 Tax=Rozella allomycis (strain CSF55) TaxID=988480 RepID=A0A075B2F5_ROZAC|nr:hypothetical protein O9G_005911 [Rozella allomycis CSF55]|eukprot:EPZ35111.1 hypothetical protein O9G_005911 [Rozella allomycis CSF55]